MKTGFGYYETCNSASLIYVTGSFYSQYRPDNFSCQPGKSNVNTPIKVIPVITKIEKRCTCGGMASGGGCSSWCDLER